MNEEQKNSQPESDLFYFAAFTLQPLLKTLESQIEGASKATDIECIHKMRVTSRRIRACLSVFKSCFPKEDSRRWQQEIRNITKSLGAARDMDIQIIFLEEHLKKLTDETEKKGVEHLLKEHRKRRAVIQPDVITNLHKLKSSGVLEEMSKISEKLPNKYANSTHSFATYRSAQKHISSRLYDFFSLKDYVHKENEIKKHHEIRIAAKRLRYTMEIFGHLYDKNLENYIDVMKNFQDLIGEMHDCDVWCEFIPSVIEEVKQKNSDIDIVNGLDEFLKFVKARRHSLYDEFQKYFEDDKTRKILSSLENLTKYTVAIPSNYQKKIAVFSDVHGNLDALKAVEDDARKNGTELFLNAGDLVGYGAFPQEVVDNLNSEYVLNIIGNYDKEVLDWGGKIPPVTQDEKEISLSYAVSQLGKSSIQFLESLPKQIRVKIGEKDMLIVHGSPESIDEHIYPDTPDQRLKELCQIANAYVIISGHSHLPVIKNFESVVFANPGSVGRPGDKDTRASYALISVKPFSIELKRIDYDIMHAVDALRQRHLPEHFVQMLLQGTSLDDLLKKELSKTKQKQGFISSWKNQKKKKIVKKVVEQYIPDLTHSIQTTKTALSLFDQLKPIHPLGPEERFWLECASLLHDIGFSHGAKGHHKTTFSLILCDPFLPLNARERQMIGIIARYHRKKPPAISDEPYGNLSISDRTRVDLLASILRVADGLDASHSSILEKVDIEINDTSVMMRCRVNGNMQLEEEMVNKKKDLFEKVFNRSLLITMQEPSAPKEK